MHPNFREAEANAIGLTRAAKRGDHDGMAFIVTTLSHKELGYVAILLATWFSAQVSDDALEEVLKSG